MLLPDAPDAIAPDGSQVRVLLRLDGGSMAHVGLAAGQVSRAVAHHAVDELWYILSGHGQMWRRQRERQETVPLGPGTCLSIPAGTHFQFRADDGGPPAAGGGGVAPPAGPQPATPFDDSPGNARLPLAGRRPVAENSLRCERWWACNQGMGRCG